MQLLKSRKLGQTAPISRNKPDPLQILHERSQSELQREVRGLPHSWDGQSRAPYPGLICCACCGDGEASQRTRLRPWCPPQGAARLHAPAAHSPDRPSAPAPVPHSACFIRTPSGNTLRMCGLANLQQDWCSRKTSAGSILLQLLLWLSQRVWQTLGICAKWPFSCRGRPCDHRQLCLPAPKTY